MNLTNNLKVPEKEDSVQLNIRIKPGMKKKLLELQAHTGNTQVEIIEYLITKAYKDTVRNRK